MSLGRNLICAAVAVVLFLAYIGTAVAGIKDLEIWIDVDGTAYLHNTTATPVWFDGYQIASEGKT